MLAGRAVVWCGAVATSFLARYAGLTRAFAEIERTFFERKRGLIVKKTSILFGSLSILLASTGIYIAIGVKSNLERLQTDIRSLQINGRLLTGRLKETDQRIISLGRGLNSVAFLAPTAGGSEPIPLSKTFLFWVPSFTDSTLKSAEWRTAEIKFHEWLSKKFGGWSRWKVEGSEDDKKPEEGWFYQVSLPKDKPDVSANSLKEVILTYFQQKTIYITENQNN